MKKRAAALLALMLLFSSFALSAATIDSIIESAKENSPSFKNTVISYKNGLLNLAQMKKNKTPTVTVSADYIALQKETPSSSDKYAMTLTPSVSYTSYDGDLSLRGSLGYSMDYDVDYITLSPNATIQYNFDFSGSDSDTLEDLNYTISELNTEYSYRSAEINFEKSVLTTIRSLFQAEKNLASTEDSIEDLETQISNIDTLGTLSKDSLQYRNTVLLLEKSKETKELLDKQFADAKENYKTLTGLEWDGVDDIREPVLELSIQENGNTSVNLSRLSVELSKETLKEAEAENNPNGLLLSGGVSGSYSPLTPAKTTSNGSFGSGAGSGDSVGFDAGIKYSGKNWSLGASSSFKWAFEKDNSTNFTPSLTISGSWSNNRNSSYESADISKKQNDVSTRENEYMQSMTSYIQQGQSLASNVMDWNFQWGQLEANISYLEDVKENKEELYSKGLITESELDDAIFDLEQVQYDKDDLLLQGLILECELRLYAL